MDHRRLGRTGLSVSRIGWGTVKLGRDRGVSYLEDFALPDEDEAVGIVHAMLDLGITLIDTAPAYGLAEARLGMAMGARRDELVLCTKVGEQFLDGSSRFDFSGAAARASLEQSLRSLRTDAVDVLLVHSDGRDLEIQHDTDLIETLQTLRDEGLTRSIGFSGKTVAGARAALGWADVLMCPYSMRDTEHAEVIASAHEADVGVLLKKTLDRGHLDGQAGLNFVLHTSPVAASPASVVIGSLKPDRMAGNIALV